jgi:hypothetical protein
MPIARASATALPAGLFSFRALKASRLSLLRLWDGLETIL